jgi:hypothetical protein
VTNCHKFKQAEFLEKLQQKNHLHFPGLDFHAYLETCLLCVKNLPGCVWKEGYDMELDERYRAYKEGVNAIMEAIIWRIHALIPLYKKICNPTT